MNGFQTLIQQGFEIKAATVITVGANLQQHLFLQKGPEVFVCIFQHTEKGFAFLVATKLA